jgi:hypothetical protein
MPIYPYNPQGRVLDLSPAKENWHGIGAAMDASDKS